MTELTQYSNEVISHFELLKNITRANNGQASKVNLAKLEKLIYEQLPADVEQFIAYMQKQLDTVEPEINREDLRRIFLDIYANPVVTKELLEKEKVTGSILL